MDLKQQTSNEYGVSQELLVLSDLVNYGVVSIPYGNSGRYDCILDIENDLYKIQIKSLNILDDGITIQVPMANTRMSANGVVKKEYTPDEVDFIAFSYNNHTYLIPTGYATRTFSITTEKPKKNTQHFIEDFRIEKILDIDLKTWNSLKEETRKHNGDFSEKKYRCIDCGAPVWKPNSRCVSCARIASRKIARPDRETLKQKIRILPFSTIGKECGVTDNSIRKWCASYELPTKVRDIKKYSDEEWRNI